MRISFILLLLLPVTLWARVPISIIYVDEKTEAKLGEFPISRDNYARAISLLSEHAPKAMVLKIFLDLPKDQDKELIKELKKHRNVFTQALAANEENEWKGKIPLSSLGKNRHRLPDHNSGWIPQAQMAAAFTGIGLVNGLVNEKNEAIGYNLVSAIKGEVYPSLALLLASHYNGEEMKFEKSRVLLGKRLFLTAPDGSVPLPFFPEKPAWGTYSFIDLIEGKIPAGTFKDHIVFFFYKGKKAAPFSLPGGRMIDQVQINALLTQHLIEHNKGKASMTSSIYDFTVKKIDGTPYRLSEHKGKVMLIVNVASKCGLTPQYEGLEKLYEKYQDKGLVVLGFPANEFLSQEPGSNAEIQEFCRTNFGIKFPMHEKIIVKGESKHPLYDYLTNSKKETTEKPNGSLMGKLLSKGLLGGKNEVKWNFEKFLIGRDGNVIDRFSPELDPLDPIIEAAIEKALKR